MKSLALCLVLSLVAIGCKPKEENATPSNPAPGKTTAQGGGGDVAPMTAPVGGITPVTADVGGGGGFGPGQAAKDMARKAAAKAGGSSLDQLNDSGN